MRHEEADFADRVEQQGEEPGLNPRWITYMRCMGETDSKRFLEREQHEWPGGSMTGYMLWIRERKQEFSKRFRQFMLDSFTIFDTEAWDEFVCGRQNCIKYDSLAERLGIVVDAPGWTVRAMEMIGFRRPAGPRRTPSPRCESGKRPYCTCDTCF